MPLQCWCKQCKRDVAPLTCCQLCGGKLNPNQAYVKWQVTRTPVRDWMCWNAAVRILIPVWLGILAVMVWMEGLARGAAGVEAMFRQGLLLTMGAVLAGLLVAVGVVLALRGQELLVCSVDGKGAHVERYLPRATALKMLMRLRAPNAHRQPCENHPTGAMLLDRQSIAWNIVARVQLWPEKRLALFYAPGWWLQLALPVSAYEWENAMEQIRKKLGKKKSVRLPQSLRVEPAPRTSKPRVQPPRATGNPAPFQGGDEDETPPFA